MYMYNTSPRWAAASPVQIVCSLQCKLRCLLKFSRTHRIGQPNMVWVWRLFLPLSFFETPDWAIPHFGGFIILYLLTSDWDPVHPLPSPFESQVIRIGNTINRIPDVGVYVLGNPGTDSTVVPFSCGYRTTSGDTEFELRTRGSIINPMSRIFKIETNWIFRPPINALIRSMFASSSAIAVRTAAWFEFMTVSILDTLPSIVVTSHCEALQF